MPQACFTKVQRSGSRRTAVRARCEQCHGRTLFDDVEHVAKERPFRLYPCFLAHPVSFPFRVSPQHPLVSSLVSRGNSVEISWFGPKISQSGKIPGYTWKLPCDRLGILPSSSVSPQILPQTSSQTQGNSRVARMEHQTPSSFPGNFRKRKVLGTLSFPFWFPETWIQAKRHCFGSVHLDPVPCLL